jgi:hypothetical protein
MAEQDPGVITWATGKPHISFSELSDWIQCPYRHKLAHIDKLGTFSITPHLILGNGVHDANENYIKTRVMDKNVAFEFIKKGWQENLDLFTNGPFPSWASNGFGTLEQWLDKADMIMDDVPKFLDMMFPGWACHSAEELLYETIENQPIKFKGFVDAVLTTLDKRGKKKYWIIDWKTCGWGWAREKQEDFNVQLQLILYKNFWTKKHGIEPRDVRCAFALLKRDGARGKSISLVPVSVGPTTTERGLKVIDNHVKSVKKGFFLKNRDACRFCEFNNTSHCPPNL